MYLRTELHLASQLLNPMFAMILLPTLQQTTINVGAKVRFTHQLQYFPDQTIIAVLLVISPVYDAKSLAANALPAPPIMIEPKIIQIPIKIMNFWVMVLTSPLSMVVDLLRWPCILYQMEL
jgi:hypothetical protein